MQLSFYLDVSSLESDFYIYENEPSAINPADIIADSLIMQASLFNSAAYCLITSIIHMQECIKKCIICDREHETNIALLRYAFREVCINTETYFEKIKTFSRYYFYIYDKIKIKKGNPRPINNEEWLDALGQFSTLNPPLFDTFKTLCKTLINSDSYKLIKKIRNDETHNLSPLFLKKIHFDEDCSEGLKYIDKGYVINNDTILENLDKIIISLSQILDLLQKIILNTDSHTITEFIERNKIELKYINEYEKRYIQTKEFIQKYAND